MRSNIAIVFLAFVLSFSRAELITGDFIAYRQGAESMAFSWGGLDLSADAWSLYYLKEFLFWFGLSFSTALFDSFDIAICFLDSICIFIYLLAFPKSKINAHKNPPLPFELIFFSFTVMMGFVNTYRQNFGLAIFLAGLHTLLMGNKKIGLLVMFLSMWVHNVFLGFFILVVISLTIKGKYLPSLLVVALCLLVAFGDAIIQSKTENLIGLKGVSSGIDAKWILASMLALISSCYLTLRNEMINADNLFKLILTMWISVIALSGVLTESTVERLLGLCLIVSFYLLLFKYYFDQSTRLSRQLLLLIAMCVMVLPTWVSSSSTGLIFP